MAQSKFTGTLAIAAGTVTDDDIDPNTNIDADKLQHLQVIGTNFDLTRTATPAARDEVVYVATTSGTIRQFSAGLYDSGTSTDVDFDLKINGTTALSAVINVVHGDGDRTIKDATLSTTTFSADDWISIDLAVTSTTGAQGPFAYVILEEDNVP